MARASNGLTAVGIAKAKKPGMLPDGHGPYLRVGLTGGKSWIFRYKRAGTTHDVGLGTLPTASLGDARLAALDLRKRRLDGDDPLAAKREAKARDQLANAKMMRFGECAGAYIAAHRDDLEKRRACAAMAVDASDLRVSGHRRSFGPAVDTALVMKILEPIWKTKSETAARVRARIERVLDWATTRGYRQGENPARWRSHIKNLS